MSEVIEIILFNIICKGPPRGSQPLHHTLIVVQMPKESDQTNHSESS